jgi:hypothetical protein
MNTQTISMSELANRLLTGVVLERDERGIKVSLLPNGNILKVFRLRRRLSSAFFFSYAKRFIRNANRLRQRHIPTVIPLHFYQVEKANDTAVEYVPLAGTTIRKLLQEGNITEQQLTKLGEFIADLHAKGIYFRSLHFGNIIAMPNGEMGLIDVADMRIYPWRLHFHTCVRNFKRISKYTEDMFRMSRKQRALVVDAYIKAMKISAEQHVVLLELIGAVGAE